MPTLDQIESVWTRALENRNRKRLSKEQRGVLKKQLRIAQTACASQDTIRKTHGVNIEKFDYTPHEAYVISVQLQENVSGNNSPERVTLRDLGVTNIPL